MNNKNSALESCFHQWKFFWNTFCDQFPEGALYEKIFKVLLGPSAYPDIDLGIVDYSHDEDRTYIKVKLKLSNDEFTIFKRMFSDRIKFVVNDEMIYIPNELSVVENGVTEINFINI